MPLADWLRPSNDKKFHPSPPTFRWRILGRRHLALAYLGLQIFAIVKPPLVFKTLSTWLMLRIGPFSNYSTPTILPGEKPQNEKVLERGSKPGLPTAYKFMDGPWKHGVLLPSVNTRKCPWAIHKTAAHCHFFVFCVCMPSGWPRKNGCPDLACMKTLSSVCRQQRLYYAVNTQNSHHNASLCVTEHINFLHCIVKGELCVLCVLCIKELSDVWSPCVLPIGV